MSNVALVVIDAKAGTFTRFLNRCFHVKVKSETPLTAAEIEGFRTRPDQYVENMPPEPRVA